jgi:uncharacterized protein YozE (UPF0346 family)
MCSWEKHSFPEVRERYDLISDIVSDLADYTIMNSGST